MVDAKTAVTDFDLEQEEARPHHVCPVWVGWLLSSPIRRLLENPTTILGPLVSPGATAVDVGCAMGFYSLALAQLVGPNGRVISLDIQEGMLAGLRKRARRKGLDQIIEARLCPEDGLGLEDIAGTADLVTAINVVHETPYPRRFLHECTSALGPGGRLLIVEPENEVSTTGFAETIAMAERAGLTQREAPTIRRSRTALLVAG